MQCKISDRPNEEPDGIRVTRGCAIRHRLLRCYADRRYFSGPSALEWPSLHEVGTRVARAMQLTH